MNIFRIGTKDGSLDRKYLRVAAVYRLLRKQIIGQARALELLAEKHTAKEMQALKGTVEIWRAHSLREMRS